MSSTNAALARRWFEEVWNRRRTETIDELLHPEGVGHLEGQETRGPDQFKVAREALLGAFPDLRVKVEDTVAEGDDAVVRWSAVGTHRGDQLGIPASGRQASFRGLTWLRFSGGRIVEGWDSWNLGGLVQELARPSD